VRFHVALATVVYLYALRHHLGQAGFVDLPADGVDSLARAVDISRLQAFPLRANSIGLHYWFGVADDYLIAPFLVGASSLESVLRRCAMFHALVAPLAYFMGAALKRPLLGLLWALTLASLPDLVSLSGNYPLNYRTTHWALLALLGTTLFASSDNGARARGLGASILLIAASLAMASHPFGVAALPAALIVCLYWKQWPHRRLAIVTALLVLACLGPYLASNFEGLQYTLFGRGSDTRVGASRIVEGTLTAARNLAGALDGFPGGRLAGILVLLGIPLSALRREARPTLWLALLWTIGSISVFLLAGYPAKTWHLRPCLYLGLGAGFVGWASALSLLEERQPALHSLLQRPRVRLVVCSTLVLGMLLLRPGSPANPANSPARGFADLSEAVLKLADGRPFQYLEAQGHCPLSWSAEATLLDLQLRSGDFTVGRDDSAPLLAAVERVTTFEEHPLASPAGDLQLANGVAMRLHWNPYPQAWREQFQKYCLAQAAGDRDQPFFVAGPAARSIASPCWVAGACQ